MTYSEENMQCVTPLRKKDPTGKYGMMDFPCGKCWACLLNKRRDWTTRLMMESENSKFSYFITLTYDDMKIKYSAEGEQNLCKRDVQLFIKRLRKLNRVRYFCAGEYGTHTQRPHYHLLVFSPSELSYERILLSWQNGNIRIDAVNEATIAYVCKFHLISTMELRGREPPFQLFSRKPGIGNCYLNDDKMVEWHLDDEKNRMWTVIGSQKRILPTYLKKKLFTSSTLQRNYEVFDAENTALKQHKNPVLEINNKIQKIESENLKETLKSKSKI